MPTKKPRAPQVPKPYTVSLSFGNEVRTKKGASLMDALVKIDLTGFKIKGVITVKFQKRKAQIAVIPMTLRRIVASTKVFGPIFEKQLMTIMR